MECATRIIKGGYGLKIFKTNLRDRLLLQKQNQLFSCLQKNGVVLVENTGFKYKNHFDERMTEMFSNLVAPYNFGVTTRLTKTNEKDVQKNPSLVIGSDPPCCKMVGHTDKSYSINVEEIPQVLVISCMKPSVFGGCTPIYKLENVEKNVQTFLPELYKNVLDNGIVYVRNFPSSSNKKLMEFYEQNNLPTLKSTFGHEDREQIYESLKYDKQMHDVNVFWVDDCLRFEYIRPVKFKDPVRQIMVWSNQIFSMNGYYSAANYLNYNKSINLDKCSFHTRLIDREITLKEFVIGFQCWENEAMKFQWKPEDCLFLDNYQYGHSRDPYQGPREHYIFLGKAYPNYTHVQENCE